MNKVLENYYRIRQEHDDALGDLEEHTSRIVNIIKEVFGAKKDVWWSFKYYSDADDDCPLPQTLEDDGKTFPIFISKDLGTREWGYNSGFPVSFFDMTDDEIRNQLKKEIADDKQKEIDEKAKWKNQSEERKLKQELLKKSAASKLTKEEKKVLGLKG